MDVVHVTAEGDIDADTVRADLESGAHLAELRGALEERDVRTFQGESEGVGHATDAATGNQYSRVLQIGHDTPSGRESGGISG